MELKELEKKYEELGKEIERLKKEQQVGFNDDPIFLLSIDEYVKYKDNVPFIKDWWWLRSPGNSTIAVSAARVNHDRSASYRGDDVRNDVCCVRPTLKLSNLKQHSVGNITFPDSYHVIYCGITWVKFSDSLYIAEMPIAYRRFDEKSNDYENSEIRHFLLNWYEERKNW